MIEKTSHCHENLAGIGGGRDCPLTFRICLAFVCALSLAAALVALPASAAAGEPSQGEDVSTADEDSSEREQASGEDDERPDVDDKDERREKTKSSVLERLKRSDSDRPATLINPMGSSDKPRNAMGAAEAFDAAMQSSSDEESTQPARKPATRYVFSSQVIRPVGEDEPYSAAHVFGALGVVGQPGKCFEEEAKIIKKDWYAEVVITHGNQSEAQLSDVSFEEGFRERFSQEIQDCVAEQLRMTRLPEPLDEDLEARFRLSFYVLSSER